MELKVYKDFNYKNNYNISLKITSDRVEYTTQLVSETNLEKNTTELFFDDLKSRIDNGGFARWTFVIEEDGTHTFFNYYLESLNSRTQVPEWCKQNKKNAMLHIITRPEDTSFDDATFFVNTCIKGTFECNKEYVISERNIPSPINPNPKYYFPKIELSKEIINGKIYININTPKTVNEDYYIKSDNGFVPNKVKVTNGVGKFIFTPISMEEGDTAKIKVGLKFVSNIASIDVTV